MLCCYFLFGRPYYRSSHWYTVVCAIASAAMPRPPHAASKHLLWHYWLNALMASSAASLCLRESCYKSLLLSCVCGVALSRCGERLD